MQIIGDKQFSEFLYQAISSAPDASHIIQELSNMDSSPNKNEWFNNHPLINSATLGNKSSLGDAAAKIITLIRSSLPRMNGYTNNLVNKLSVNQDFIRMFIVNEGFRSAALQALAKYNDSIKMGTTNKSQTQQL